ncbi:ATP-binding protein [Bacillus sp. SG-1]|uniref:ATP-binding protein n=1 Tax=Bacillus sp. SG-1 TaxID=161544 RepID=UPI00031EFC3A|nr:AAA family ATPase [Bacillus sp. SG-1]
MKITDIHIYGFGKLENFKVKDLQQFSVFYGENEAGKSTIMAFIHGVLFGFPTKLHAEQRYEPKTHAKYGGRLTLINGNGDSITVERVKGKAAGDVTVFYKDGSIGDEEELKKELQGIDKSTFQGIYSFNIHGLQEISRLKEEEINRYLFSSGMTGTDAIFKLEEQWQKELDRLFKKSGKKPEINQKLTELRETELQLKKAKEKNETFTLLLQKKNKSEESLSALHREMERKEEELKQVETLKKSWHDLHEYQDIRDRLKELEDITSFPIDGLQRLDNWQTERARQQSVLEVTNSRLGELEKAMEESMPDKPIAERASLLSSLLEKRELFTKWQDQAAEYERTISQLNAKIGHLRQELKVEELDSLSGVQLDMVTKDRVKSTEESLYKLQVKKESLQESIQAEENQVHYFEQRCTELEDRMLEEPKFQELQKRVRESKEADTLKIQYELVQEQLRENKERTSKKSKKALPLLTGVLSSVITALLVWFATDSLLLAAVASVAILAVSLFLISSQENKGGKSYWSDLKNKAEVLQEKIQAQENQDNDNYMELYKEQSDLRESWKQWVLKLENHQHRLLKLGEEYRNWAAEEEAAQEEFHRLAKELRLPLEMHWKLLGEAFEKLKELMKLIDEKQNNVEVYHNCLKKISNFKMELEDAVEGLALPLTSVEETLVRIKDALLINERKSLSYEHHKKQYENALKEREIIQVQLNTIKCEIRELLTAGEAETAEDFRRKAALVNEKNSLQQQERILLNRLGMNLIRVFNEIKEKDMDMSGLKINLDEVLTDIKQKIYKENENLAEAVYEISVLEEGESYTRLLYKYQEQKASLNELSREWLKYSLARSALKKTIEDYKKEKLPKVIQTAGHYLGLLTNGEYSKIRSQQEKTFVVTRNDGMVFSPDELSQGTKEQVYIALRFALVGMLKDVYSMPVIIDDGFVNFDEKRTEAVMKLLGKIKDDIQVLFFTCHPHILKHVKSGEIVHLSNSTNEALTMAGENR